MPELWDIFQGNSITEGGTRPKERSVLHSTKIKGLGHLKSILTSDIKMQNLEFDQLGFDLTLVQCFLTMLPSLCFQMVMYILCHYMLEVCDIFYFDFIGDYS